ncbi:hypothetical protein N7533_002255 [Penicillium manginii]|uniref:uncharacterized protein n=1 Tax=Penicillium manginii TaxID=203109 RepID=UPI00254792B5|nr:uncharacterized protein N7533_002255 [Penicillium manginii]KAJ5763574.1 hypothetical protein N7533_002255 [Penicillium manginii]
MFEAIKNWFQSAEGPSAERKWDANAVTMQQPTSPSAPKMSNTITEQPGASQSMDVHMRGGGAGEAVLVSAALNAASAAAEMMDPPVPPVPLVAVVQVGEASNGRGLSLIRNSAGLEFATIVVLAFFLYFSSMYYNVLAWPDL